MLFYDSDTDKVYLYYGSGAATPMMGMELDKKTFMPKGEAIPLFYSNAENTVGKYPETIIPITSTLAGLKAHG